MLPTDWSKVRVDSAKEQARMLAGAFDALAALHSVDLVHADIKPDNLLVDSLGRTRVIDYGGSRPASDYPKAEDIRRLGICMIVLREKKDNFPMLTDMRELESYVQDSAHWTQPEKDLLKRIIANDPSLRPTASQLATEVRELYGIKDM